MKNVFYLLIFVLLLAACGGSTSEALEPEQETAVLETVPPVADPTPTLIVVPTDEPTAIPAPEDPTAVPTDEPMVEEVVEEPVVEEVVPETAVIAGRLDEGAFFYGNPNAPITLIDYSDFL